MRTRCLVGLIFLLCSCGDNEGSHGPFDGLPTDQEIRADGLDGPVDVVRDEYGVPHVYATTMDDLAFVHGYVMASDRLPQMDLFRHFASATIAELFGALDASQIDTDLEMRMHRMRPLAEEAWAELQASSEPRDQEVVRFLTRFSDGINQYLDELARGEHELDPAVAVWFDASRAAPWTPVNSLAIGRLQAWSLSYEDGEIGRTQDWQRAFDRFDRADAGTYPERAARAGIGFDLFPFKPMDTTSTIDGFPPGATARRAGPRRPHVPEALLAQVAHTLARKKVGNYLLHHPDNGSNNWVAGPAITGGLTIMSNDPHLQLSSPSIFYLVHLTVPDRVDVEGITFPGIPGVILGHNQHLAWGATTVNHDVTDFYLEDVAPCTSGGGDCVSYDGGQVPIESWQETIKIGALGTITDQKTVTYERVPHHGPIVPAIADHDLAPRTGNQAISVRYTGYQVTHELRSFYRLWTASSVEEGIAAMDDFGFGGQNWVFADDAGHIGWTSHALLPRRTAGCFGFDPDTAPEGVAPWWVVPGDGTCEWDGFFSTDDVPHAVDPAKGFLATANNDPIGATADGNPLNQPTVEDHLYYVGAKDYDPGWRVGRITRRIQALIDAGGGITADDMTSIQADTYSNFGSALAPHLVDAIEALQAERQTPGTYTDLQSYAAGLTAADDAFLATAHTLLSAWSYETPAAVGGSPSQDELTDSAATALFNDWVVELLPGLFGDEASVLGYGASTWLAPAAYAVFVHPDQLATGLATETGEPLLCDDMRTAGTVESCRLEAVMALLRARNWLSSANGFGSSDPNDWRWGLVHRLTLAALVPADELSVPPPNEANPDLAGGYPRHGDQFSVDASSPGYGDTDFTYGHGPAMRHVTEFAGGDPVTHIALPGGEIYDRNSGHFRDLMDNYWSVNKYFILPWTTAQIIDTAESHWRFRR